MQIQTNSNTNKIKYMCKYRKEAAIHCNYKYKYKYTNTNTDRNRKNGTPHSVVWVANYTPPGLWDVCSLDQTMLHTPEKCGYRSITLCQEQHTTW